MSDDDHEIGFFDYSPVEELAPIWVAHDIAICLGDVPAPSRERHPGPTVIRLERHEIFGTGGHPSTKGAIRVMRELLLWGGVSLPFLEVGATTGILALVAASQGIKQVYHGSDFVQAAALAEDNAKRNDLRITTEPMIISTDLDERFEFYQTIATTVGGSIAALEWIPSIYHSLAPSGSLIWAGHRARDHRDIKARLEEFFEPVAVSDLEGWPVILLQKGVGL